MVTAGELIRDIDVQSEVCYCYYDDNREERIEITGEQAREKEIKYLYCEDNIIYIEVYIE